MNERIPRPTDAELAILRVLWDRGPSTVREVHDALVTHQSAQQVLVAETRRRDLLTQALDVANIRYEAGYAQFLDVLDSQRTLNLSQLALIRSRQNQLSADVDLMAALGGGWQPAEQAAEPSRPRRSSVKRARHAERTPGKGLRCSWRRCCVART